MGRRVDALTFGPQRRARRMMRRLQELDREDARLRAAGIDPLDEWRRSRDPRAGHGSASSSTGPQRRARTVLAVIAVAAAMIAVLIWQHDGPATRQSIAGAPAARPGTIPPAGIEEQPDRLGEPQAAPAGVGGYRFERTQPDASTPVAWDPCRPIHYATSGSAPPGEANVISSALAEVTRLTGFRFVDDGTTTEPAATNRLAYQPARYGRRWAPVLVAWTTPEQVPTLAGNVIGLGGATAVHYGSSASTYVSGIVYLDSPQWVATMARTRQPAHTRAVLRAVVLHEIGHLIGLAHVTDAASVMYPEAGLTVTDYAPGDLRGLYAESQGRCAPEL